MLWVEIVDLYKCDVIDKFGIESTEVLEGVDFAELSRKASSEQKFIKSVRKIRSKSLNISQNDLINLLNHLRCQHLESFSVIKSLESFVRVSDNCNLVFLINKTIAALKRGKPLSSAFRCIFDESLIGFLVTLEKTGDFLTVIDSMIEYLEIQKNIRTGFLSKMKYPIFMFLFTSITFILFLEFIAPSFLESCKGDLVNYSLYLYKILILALLGYIGGCFFSDKFNASNWISGNVITRLNNLYFSMSLLINLKSKLNLISALENAIKSIRNLYIKRGFISILKEFKEGASLVESFSNKKFVNKQLLEFISIGEVNNQIITLLKAYNEVERAKLLNEMKYLSFYLSVFTITLSGVLLVSILLFVFAPLYGNLFNVDLVR